MTDRVTIVPLPTWARKTKFRPMPPPIFAGNPTPEDVELALALLAELDEESQAWYGGPALVERLKQRR